MEFKSDFILASVALRDIVQWDLESRVGANVEAEDSSIELGRAPVPPLE